MNRDDRPLGNVANELLFENDLVCVWAMNLAPGERSDRHRHDLPYLLCVLEGSRVDAEVEGIEEYYSPERSPSNEELVREAVRLVERVGRPLADSAAAARILDLPPIANRGPF